jgi:hypothetical protein
MLLTKGVTIVSISVLLITFIVFVSAQNLTEDISSAWNITEWNITNSQNVTNSRNSTNTTETISSESLTLEGLSHQEGSTLTIGCLYFLQHC